MAASTEPLESKSARSASAADPRPFFGPLQGWTGKLEGFLQENADRIRKSIRGMIFRAVVNRWTIPVWDRWNPARTTGARGERAAERYLRQRGWITVARNWLATHGELDLVMVDGRTVVFVEVKSWLQGRAGQSPAEAVTDDKERAVSLAASEFIVQHHLERNACRFDVVAVLLDSVSPQITHYVAAFEPPIDW